MHALAEHVVVGTVLQRLQCLLADDCHFDTSQPLSASLNPQRLGQSVSSNHQSGIDVAESGSKA
jgi:hypothetical protein